ncbi:hypothetical protein HBN50_06550 [Halobacteriovorax sp. GB3]|uniref:hypothetical protein n=1 Tax=Halobacteriovorax sp. GB3 TaxID=2719615 RepID=UPI002360E9D4|nr:hypothetical protein [Halobacteriovorax sp. GB3]MDD0852747.1 hypothetical protein [Halobacteriovorax sp. GB3]
MKKLLLGLSLLSVASSFASDCNVYLNSAKGESNRLYQLEDRLVKQNYNIVQSNEEANIEVKTISTGCLKTMGYGKHSCTQVYALVEYRTNGSTDTVLKGSELLVSGNPKDGKMMKVFAGEDSSKFGLVSYDDAFSRALSKIERCQ